MDQNRARKRRLGGKKLWFLPMFLGGGLCCCPYKYTPYVWMLDSGCTRHRKRYKLYITVNYTVCLFNSNEEACRKPHTLSLNSHINVDAPFCHFSILALQQIWGSGLAVCGEMHNRKTNLKGTRESRSQKAHTLASMSDRVELVT